MIGERSLVLERFMRVAVLIAALACAPLAHADGVRESRFGPERERAPTPMNGSPAYGAQPYAGPTLGWSGKREAVAPIAPQAAAHVQPWWARAAAVPAPQQTARTPVAPPARQTAVQQVPARALPQNIFDAPPPVQPQAYAQAPVAPTAAALRARPEGQTTARTYSVGRQFGLQPDPIPAAGPSRMVLVGPPATAPDDEPAERKDDTQ